MLVHHEIGAVFSSCTTLPHTVVLVIDSMDTPLRLIRCSVWSGQDTSAGRLRRKGVVRSFWPSVGLPFPSSARSHLVALVEPRSWAEHRGRLMTACTHDHCAGRVRWRQERPYVGVGQAFVSRPLVIAAAISRRIGSTERAASATTSASTGPSHSRIRAISANATSGSMPGSLTGVRSRPRHRDRVTLDVLDGAGQCQAQFAGGVAATGDGDLAPRMWVGGTEDPAIQVHHALELARRFGDGIDIASNVVGPQGLYKVPPVLRDDFDDLPSCSTNETIRGRRPNMAFGTPASPAVNTKSTMVGRSKPYQKYPK